MRVKKFFAPDMRSAMKQVREELGADAAILARNQKEGGVEIVCALDFIDENEEIKEKLNPPIAYASQTLDSNLPTDLEQAKNAIIGLSTPTSTSPSLEFNKNILNNTYQANSYEDDLQKARDAILNSNFSNARQSFASPYNNHDNNYYRTNTDKARHETPSGFSSAPSASESLAIQAMQSEIKSLRELLSDSMRDNDDKINPTEAMIRKRLEVFGFEKDQIRKLILASQINETEQLEDSWRKILSCLKSDISVLDEDMLENGGVIAFVGSTGVGKTSLIGKLASRYVLKHGADSLALITTDSHRIAAYEQLRTFGRILGVPVRILDGKDSLDAVLKSLRNKSLIFIDTAGFANSDKAIEEQMQILNTTKNRIRKILVLSATNQLEFLRNTCDTYYKYDISGLVFSKVDEAIRFGDCLSVASSYKLPIAYIATGQRIPDDLQIAKSRDLVNLLLNMNEKKL